MATQKILVIDDSKVIRMRVKEMLPQKNVEIIEAKDGAQGFQMIREKNPNLIMLDFLLPKMSGWEVYQEIQKHPELHSIPLVVMSGRKEEVTEKVSEPFAYFSFVGKPFEQKQLMDAIKEATQKARSRPVVAAATDTATSSGGGADTAALEAEIEMLKGQMSKMHNEIQGLKKQLVQLANFIKQKIK
ncbi:MAG: response regulator [Jaaginema sp. PMC 1079.18]|nr:response regulator [Jaaginema sp. PMC 1080.18]MEC4851070.1 response regulator [Jaaginema sp. PMC 1079.18]MEC4865043.1 response regulator [Jaaginema sp. PMC 1078.18]